VNLTNPEIDVVKLYGIEEHDHLARGIAGDFNSDGIQDLIVAAPDSDPYYKEKAGEVYILWGEDIGDNDTIDLRYSPVNYVKILGNDIDGHLGFSMSMGDINGDNVNDLIIGAHDSSPHGIYQAGKIYVISGTGTHKIDPSSTHFQYETNTGNNALLLIRNIIDTTSGKNLVSYGDEIGVFSENGLCVGTEFWEGSNCAITIWGDNSQTSIIDGMRADEQYEFKLWDSETGNIYSLALYGDDIRPKYQADGIDVIESLVCESTVSVDEIDSAPEILLGSNYPNPFNPVTTISYTVSEKCLVTLTVFNVVGEKVAVLENTELFTRELYCNMGCHRASYRYLFLPFESRDI